MADNIGNNTSSASIGRTLVSEGLLEDGRKAKSAVLTISAYIDALMESYVFYEVKRFDIKGKDYLRALGKYYIVDTGLRSYLLGNRGGDTGHILENIIYFELLLRRYDVAIGKIDEKEIDFIVTATAPTQASKAGGSSKRASSNGVLPFKLALTVPLMWFTILVTCTLVRSSKGRPLGRM